MGRFTLNPDQNDQRPMLHILSNKCFLFVIFVSSYPRGLYVTATAWPCTYLFLIL